MTETVRERLARLRRETASCPGSASGDGRAEGGGGAGRNPTQRGGGAAGLPVWLRKRIAAGAARRSGTELDPESGVVLTHAQRQSEGPPEGLRREENARGAFWARTLRFTPEHRHGDWPLGEVLHASPADLALLAKDEALRGFDPARAVYLDVETTGLSGGAGTTSFLVALGSFEGDDFVLWQGFLKGPEEEAAMLAESARRIAASSAIVSFFGKSFDRHRLEDKMRLHSVNPPFAGRPHLDLYHPLGRLYRSAFPDGRLQTMERRLCAVVRPSDLPGRFAPDAWLDFLAGRPHRLEDVFQHNADDVLSLVTLTAHLGRTCRGVRAGGRELAGPRFARGMGLARIRAARRDDSGALGCVDAALAALGASGREDVSPGKRREAALLRGLLLRKVGRFEEAFSQLSKESTADRDAISLEAAVAAAKIAEHQLRDPDAALELCERALTLVAVARTGERRRRGERELLHRRARLTDLGRARTKRKSSQGNPMHGPRVRRAAP